MDAELIVVNGPLAGTRYPLAGNEVLIGRAPSASVVLSEPEVGWRHCQIRHQGNRHVVVDLRTSVGTYVNGTRSAERWLDDRDQIGVGKTILMFRSAESLFSDAEFPSAATATAPSPETKPLLLAACYLTFLFRALAASRGDTQTAKLRDQILSLVSDILPHRHGVLLLSESISDLLAQGEDVGAPSIPGLSSVLARVCEEGAIADPEYQICAVPLYLSGRLGGALLLQMDQRELPRFGSHLETLTAIASLASVGFEANQEIETLRAEYQILQEQVHGSSGIVGTSAPIRRLIDLVNRVAPRDTTVLIMGESGTGKELIARALHHQSPRRERPFIAVNCAALSETLFESELFGHEKGAFSGAIAMKRGRFELAEGGTIFLDEVGELAIGLQAKILRVLQQREFERVGGTQVYPLDIRIIAATNRDLSDDLLEGRFREDLYHRLNVVSLQSPPLRERTDDILALAEHFLARFSRTCNRHVLGLSPKSKELILRYKWPGNVRELENAMERAVVLGLSEWILPEDLPESLLESSSSDTANSTDTGSGYHEQVNKVKRRIIIDAYANGKGDYKQAAKLLGLHPNYLLRLVRNMDLRDDIQGST